MAASTGSSLAWYLFAETERWAVSAKTRSAGQRLVGLLGTCGGLEPGGPVSFCGVWDPQKIHSVQRTAEDVEKVYTMCAQCGFEEQVTSVDNPTGSAWNISKKKKNCRYRSGLVIRLPASGELQHTMSRGFVSFPRLRLTACRVRRPAAEQPVTSCAVLQLHVSTPCALKCFAI